MHFYGDCKVVFETVIHGGAVCFSNLFYLVAEGKKYFDILKVNFWETSLERKKTRVNLAFEFISDSIYAAVNICSN